MATNRTEYQFRINRPDDDPLSLSRVAEYLNELVELLGEDAEPRLVRIENNGNTVVFNVKE